MRPETIRQLKKELGQIVKNRHRYFTRSWVPALIALLLISQKPVKKKKRKPSKWNVFLGTRIKQGYTIWEAADDWRKLKAKK